MKRIAAAAVAGGCLALEALASSDPPPDGFHATPSLYWKQGDHRVDLALAERWRTEGWDGSDHDFDIYTALRTRVRFQYGWRDRLLIVAEGQDVRLYSLEFDAVGAEKLYFDNSGEDSNTHGTDLRTLFLEARPLEDSFVRLGRQDIKLGNEVVHSEADWKYLKTARIAERFVGTVGWSHAERAYDGGAASARLGGHHFFGFFAQPTTGVFDVDSAYSREKNILVGGLAWTAERDSWLPQTELGAFALYYEDDRDSDDGGLASGLEVYTVGVQALGIYPAGPGRFDWLAVGVGQWGEYDSLDHEAYAGLLEIGYRLPEVFAKPWLRIGINLATGDNDPSDGRHGTFFNLLPTNHLYYGYADQFAFQNIVNPFVQLRLAPHEKVGLNLFLHRFTLASSDDSKYAGTGAFNRKVFGFPATASRGYRYLGTELDAVATLTLHKAVTIELGVAKLWVGKMLREDIAFGYASVELKY